MKEKIILPIFFLILLSLSLILAMPPTIVVSSEFKVTDNIEFFLKNTLESDMSLSQVKIYDSNDNIVYGSGPIGKTLVPEQSESVLVWNQEGNSGSYDNNIVQSGNYMVTIIYSYEGEAKEISKVFNIPEPMPVYIDLSPPEIFVGDNIEVFVQNTQRSPISISQIKFIDSSGATVYGSGPIGITLTPGQSESVLVWNQEGNSGSYDNNIVQSGTYLIMVAYSIDNAGKDISREFNIQEINIDETGCKDLDNGDNIGVPSRVIYYLEGQKHILQDTCFNSTYLYEAVCNEENIGESKGHNCNECFVSDGYGFCKEESSQEEIIPREKPIEEIEESGEKCKFGCLLDENCYPIGFRQNGKFCSSEKTFLEYKKSGEICENNFECKTNLCIDGECLSSSIWQKILNFFKNLFG